MQDGVCVLKDRGNNDQPNWGLYNKIKTEQQSLAGEILSDFSSHQLYVQQAGMTKDMLEVKSNKRERPLSLSEQHAEKTVELYKTYTKLMDSGYGTDIISSERWYLGKEILKNYAIHREFMNKHSVHKKHVESLYVPFQLKEIVPQQAKPADKPFDYQTHIHTVKENLNDHIGDLAQEFLGKPQRQMAKEWRYGKKGSICVHVAGAQKGLYANFETGEHGGALKLIQDNLGLEHKEAFKWGSDWLKDRGHDIGIEQHQNNNALTKSVKPALLKEEKEHIPEAPTYKALPEETAFPDIKNHPSLRYMLKGRHVTGTYTYRDIDNHILGHVVRLEDNAGNKITPTLTFQKAYESSDNPELQCGSLRKMAESDRAQNHSVLDVHADSSTVKTNQFSKDLALEGWKWKGFGDNRPLYGLEKFNQRDQNKENHVDKPILLVEGEKTADKAQALFPDHHVLTWSGGCGAVKKSDWSALKDKDITIWPDHDKAGLNAANKIAGILKEHHQTTPKIVDLDPSLPAKWDLADDRPKHLDIHKGVHEAREYDKAKSLENTSMHNAKRKKVLSQELIEKVAKKLGVKLNSGFEHKEVALMNTLYDSYRELNPEMHKTDMIIKAVSVGIHMHDFHLQHGKSEAFHDEDMTKAYKVGLTAYHAIDHFGASKPAYHHACKLHAEGHINESLHHDLEHHEHYKDQTMDHHMETINQHLKVQEHHLEQVHQAQQLQIQMQHQHSIGGIDR